MCLVQPPVYGRPLVAGSGAKTPLTSLNAQKTKLASARHRFDPCALGRVSCGLRKGLTIYLAVFLVLDILGFYHFAPVEHAAFGSTFVGSVGASG